MEYTARLDIVIMNRRPRLRSVSGNGRGSGIQIVRARSRARVGVMRKSRGEEEEGWMGSLMKSFTPSARG